LQIFSQVSLVNVIQAQTVGKENLCKIIFHKKGARKMLVKLTTEVDFTNILQAALLIPKAQKDTVRIRV